MMSAKKESSILRVVLKPTVMRRRTGPTARTAQLGQVKPKDSTCKRAVIAACKCRPLEPVREGSRDLLADRRISIVKRHKDEFTDVVLETTHRMFTLAYTDE